MLSNIISFVASKFTDKAINAGIDAVIGDDSGGGGGGSRVTPPNMHAAKILSSSQAGIVTPIDATENSYEKNLLDWERRLIEYTQSSPVVSKMNIY